MNNDSDLNLHSMTKLSGWLRYWVVDHIVVMVIMTSEGDGNDRDNDGGRITVVVCVIDGDVDCRILL